MCVGLESVMVTKDIVGLGGEEAVRVKQWAARALLAAALADADADQATRRRGER